MTIRRFFLGTCLLSLLAEAASAQSWQYIAPMRHARTRHSAVLLQDGKILVAGGDDGVEVLRSCEIYDPSQNSWADTDSLNIPRMNFQLLPLNDGRVLAAGGLTNENIGTAASCEIYNPISGKWSMTASMHDRRTGFQAVILPSNKIVFIGGLDGDAHQYLSSCELFNESTETISAFPSLVVMTSAASAVYLSNSNSILLPGGYFGGYNGYQLSSTQRYSFQLSRWYLADSLLESQGNSYNVFAQPLTDKVFVVAGDINTEATIVTGTIEYYNPINGHWSKSNASITPCFLNRVVMIGSDSILSIGGQDALLNPISDCWWYNCSTDQAMRAPSLLIPQEEGAQIVSIQPIVEAPCESIRTIYFLGGKSSKGIVAVCEALDIGTARTQPAITLIPNTFTINTNTPCDTINLPITISATGCDSIELISAYLSDSTPVSLSGIQLPVILDSVTKVTIQITSRDTTINQGITLLFQSGGTFWRQHIDVQGNGSLSPAFDIPTQISMSGSLCSAYDTTITIQNLGCDTMWVDSVYITKATQDIFAIRDSEINIAPATNGTIHITASPSTFGNFSALLNFRIVQYGATRDTSIQIAVTVSNEKPYSVQTILKDVKDAYTGDTIEMPLYLISNLTNATSCIIDLAYNTDILEQLDPDLTGTLLEGIALFDLKERSNSSTLNVPTSFALNNTKPLVKLRFCVSLSDTDRSLITIRELTFGTGTISTDACLALVSDTALVNVTFQCGEPLIYQFMRDGKIDALRITQSGNDLWIGLPERQSYSQVTLFDLLGQRVLGWNLEGASDGEPVHLSLSSVRTGTYFLRAEFGGIVSQRSILILR